MHNFAKTVPNNNEIGRLVHHMACLSQEEGFLVNFRNNQHRLMFSGLTALVGLTVSFSMMYVGGPTAHHLPGIPFHIGAFLGAGAAGWFCLRAF